MLRIGINGACGKMGLRLAQLINQQHDLKLTLALEQTGHPVIGRDIGLIAGFNSPLHVPVESRIRGKICDIILDFSTPSATMNRIRESQKYGMAFLSGTTGLIPTELKKLKQAGKKIPVLISPNFSQGARLLGKLGQDGVRRLGKETNIEIIETHHRHKRDAPSGTALRLAQQLNEVVPDREIPIHSVRVGDVVGEHKIVMAIPGERVELIHLVDNRDAFAYGALKIARLLARKKAGFYTMDNLLDG